MATYADVKEALQLAIESGNAPLANALADKLESKDYEEDSSGLQSAAIGVGQGLSFGFGDEISAGIRAGLGGFFEDEGRGLGERYKDALAGTRERLETARREDPWLTGIGEVAGGLATGGAGMARSLGTQAARQVAGRTMGQGIKKAAGTGAAMGAAAGWGYSDSDPIATTLDAIMDPGEMTEEQFGNVYGEFMGVAKDAAIGGSLGLTLGGAIPAVGSALRVVGRAFGRLRPSVRQKLMTEDARREIAQAIENDARAKGLTVQQLTREMDDLGLKVGDLGPETQKLVEGVAQTSTVGGTNLRTTLAARNIGQVDRMHPRLARYLAPDNTEAGLGLAHVKAKLFQDRADDAERLYNAAKNQRVRLNEPMRKFMGEARSRGALGSADDIRMANELPGLPKDLTKVADLSVDELDAFIQGWDQKLNRMWKNKPKSANAWKKRFTEFKEQVYKQSDEYAEARNTWSSNTKLNEALEQGEALFKRGPDVTEEIVKGFDSPGELEYFRLGAMRQLVRAMEKAPDDADAIKRIIGGREKKRIIRAVFGDDASFDDFMRYVQAEKAKFDTFKAANLNSTTIKRLMQQVNDPVQDMAGLMARSAAMSAGGGLATMGISARLGQRLMRGLRGYKPDEQAIYRANTQSGMLMQGQQGVQDLMKPYTMQGLLNTDIPQMPLQALPRAMGGAAAGGLLAPDNEFGGL